MEVCAYGLCKATKSREDGLLTTEIYVKKKNPPFPVFALKMQKNMDTS